MRNRIIAALAALLTVAAGVIATSAPATATAPAAAPAVATVVTYKSNVCYMDGTARLTVSAYPDPAGRGGVEYHLDENQSSYYRGWKIAQSGYVIPGGFNELYVYQRNDTMSTKRIYRGYFFAGTDGTASCSFYL